MSGKAFVASPGSAEPGVTSTLPGHEAEGVLEIHRALRVEISIGENKLIADGAEAAVQDEVARFYEAVARRDGRLAI